MHIQTQTPSRPQPRPQARRHALLLERAAHLLDTARDPAALSWAVQNNLSVWLSLKTAAEQDDLADMDARRVLDLAAHVIKTTLASGRIAPHDAQIEAFITMNRTLAQNLSSPASTAHTLPARH